MDNLKRYRKEKGITQIRLSIEAEVTQETTRKLHSLTEDMTKAVNNISDRIDEFKV